MLCFPLKWLPGEGLFAKEQWEIIKSQFELKLLLFFFTVGPSLTDPIMKNNKNAHVFQMFCAICNHITRTSHSLPRLPPFTSTKEVKVEKQFLNCLLRTKPEVTTRANRKSVTLLKMGERNLPKSNENRRILENW